MVRITLIDAVENRFEVDAEPASTLMETAIIHEIPSIVGFCGGMSACGTCHCYPEGGIADALPERNDNEKDMLGRVLDPLPSSRLACQIRIDQALDGLVVRLPSRQRTP